MASLNKIILVGTVSSEPDIKATTSGDSVSNFTLTVQRPPRTDGLESLSDTFKVVAWKQVADKTSSFFPGQIVLVEGRIHTRSYDDQSGNRHYVTEVEAKELRGLDGEYSSQSTAAASPNVHINESSVIEPMDQTITPFQFDDFNKEELGNPPSFGQDVEEDIPF